MASETETRAGRPVGGYLPTLDGWRAIAIVAVMTCHLQPPGGPAEYGAKGVSVFFGISGFLICSRLLDEERRAGRISLSSFYVRRTFRILPPYLAYLAAVAAMAALGLLTVRRVDLLSCLLFFRNYLTPWSLGSWYTGHFWSLAVEEHFYLLWPGLLVLWGPARARWRVVALALAIAAWRLVDFRLLLVNRLLPGVALLVRTDVCLDGLLWGCWLALMLDLPWWRDWLTRRLSTGVWLALIAAYVVVVVRTPPLALFWEAILIPFILAGTVLRPRGIAGRLLECAPAKWVGRMSYSLYLWQQMFLVPESSNRIPALAWLQTWPLNLGAVFACAAVSFYLIERPMIRVGHALSKRYGRPRPPVAESLNPAPAIEIQTSAKVVEPPAIP